MVFIRHSPATGSTPCCPRYLVDPRAAVRSHHVAVSVGYWVTEHGYQSGVQVMVVGQITRDLVLTVDDVPGPTGTTRVRTNCW